jgi:hypothetical protein
MYLGAIADSLGMTPISDQERERLQAQDVALAYCPHCGSTGLFSPDDTISYACGSHLAFGQRRGEREVAQSEGCQRLVADGKRPHPPVTGQVYTQTPAAPRRPMRP